MNRKNRMNRLTPLWHKSKGVGDLPTPLSVEMSDGLLLGVIIDLMAKHSEIWGKILD